MGSTMAARGTTRKTVAKRVLAKIRKTGSVVAACKAVGIAPTTWWKWRQEDPELAAASDKMLDQALRHDLDVAQTIGRRLGERALAGDREAERDYLGRYVSPVAIRMAQVRLPEYRRDQASAGGGNTSITLNVALAGLMPQPTPAPAVIIEQPAAPALSQDDAESA